MSLTSQSLTCITNSSKSFFNLSDFSLYYSDSFISTDWFNSKINAEGIILDTTGAGEAVNVETNKNGKEKHRTDLSGRKIKKKI